MADYRHIIAPAFFWLFLIGFDIIMAALLHSKKEKEKRDGSGMESTMQELAQ
jgi:hypothetical protein